MEIEAKNPRYNKDGSIDIELRHLAHGWIPFTASENDAEVHGKALFEMAKRGDFGKVKQYVEGGNNG